MSLHVSKKFTIHGSTYYDLLLKEHFDPLVNQIMVYHSSQLAEKWRLPLINDIRHKITEEYGMNVRGVIVCLLLDGTDYIVDSKLNDIPDKSSCDFTGCFIVTCGAKRILRANVGTNIGGEYSAYKAEDGDLFYFTKSDKIGMPKIIGMKEPSICMYFVV